MSLGFDSRVPPCFYTLIFLFLFHSLHRSTVRPYVSRGTLLGFTNNTIYKEKLFITKFVEDIFTGLLSVIPKWKTQGEGSEKGVVYDTLSLCMTQRRLAILGN